MLWNKYVQLPYIRRQTITPGATVTTHYTSQIWHYTPEHDGDCILYTKGYLSSKLANATGLRRWDKGINFINAI